MKTIKIIHYIVDVIALGIIAGAMFMVGTMDFKVLGGTMATVMTIAQIVVCLTCVPGGLQVHKSINSLFEWVEEKFEEMMEE